MIGSILLFVLFILLIGILFTIALLRTLYHRSGLSYIVNMFRQKPQDEQSQQQSADGQHRSGTRQTRTSSGNIIIDRRDPEKANRKIFDDDEGEYVDFKEE